MIRLRKTLALVAALALVVVACGNGEEVDAPAAPEPAPEAPAPEAPEEPEEGIVSARPNFTMTIGEEPPSLDPVGTSSAAMQRVIMFNVLETIVETDPETGDIVPGLAESWTVSEDGLTYVFTIREGATFSTGDPVLASDVVFSMEAMRSEEAAGARQNDMEPVDTITALDDRTVEVTLERSSIRWLLLMAEIAGVVFSEAHYDSIALEPIGSGPFMIDRWASGDRMVLVPNPHWNGEGPYLERVDMLFIDDTTASITALLGGEIDAIWNLRGQLDRLPEFEGQGFESRITATNQIAPVTFNVTIPPFDDIRVRQAVAHAIDKEGVLQLFAQGFGETTYAWVSPSDPWFDPDFDPYPFDQDRARELLAEAGYPDGVTIEMAVIPANPSGEIGEIVALMLEEVGINVQLNFLEVPVFLDQVAGQGQNPGMAIVRSTTDLERWTGPQGWHSWWDNEEYDDLVLGSDAAATFQEFVEMRREATRIFGTELPAVVLMAGVNIALYEPGIEGWVVHLRTVQDNDVRFAYWTD